MKNIQDDDYKVALDARHAIQKEGTGSLERQWVFRFCGDFISSHETKKIAIAAAHQWESKRIAKMIAIVSDVDHNDQHQKQKKKNDEQ